MPIKTFLNWNRLRRAFGILQRDGIPALKSRIFGPDYSSDYQEWIQQFDTLSERDRKQIQCAIELLPERPLISIIMAVHNTSARWLRAALQSVTEQLYTNWELCIADDASATPHVRQILEEYQIKDKRIKVTFRREPGHISAAMNSALELATGRYVAFLDHDDELTEHALYLIAREAVNYPDARLIYTDEDKIRNSHRRFRPHFKPDWNPDLMLSQNYICHLCAIERELATAAGGFRSRFDGAQDWDLILRVTEKLAPAQIRHIPHVAYHWRVADKSTAASVSFKPYVFSAQSSAVREHLERRGVSEAKVELLEEPSRIRVHFPLPSQPPLVSIIVAAPEDWRSLKRCLKSLQENTSYPSREILLLDHGKFPEEGRRYLESLSSSPIVRILKNDAPVSVPAGNNFAASQAGGSILAFLEGGLEIISRDWLKELVSFALRPETGAVGARIIFSNNLLQHTGLILGTGMAATPAHKRLSRHNPGYFDRAASPQNLSAVSGACMVMRKDVFEKSGGFDSQNLSAAFSDIDLCLKIRSLGYLITYNPWAELYCFAADNRYYNYNPSRATGLVDEISLLRARWGDVLNEDPYYNPNLNSAAADFTLAFPPRREKPWRDS